MPGGWPSRGVHDGVFRYSGDQDAWRDHCIKMKKGHLAGMALLSQKYDDLPELLRFSRSWNRSGGFCRRWSRGGGFRGRCLDLDAGFAQHVSNGIMDIRLGQ